MKIKKLDNSNREKARRENQKALDKKAREAVFLDSPHGDEPKVVPAKYLGSDPT